MLENPESVYKIHVYKKLQIKSYIINVHDFTGMSDISL